MEESSTNDKNVDWDSTDDTVKQKCKPKLVEKKPTSVFPEHTMVCSPNTPFVLKITHDKMCFWGV